MHHLGICKSNQPSRLTRKPPRKSRFPTIHHQKKHLDHLTISSFFHLKVDIKIHQEEIPSLAHPIIPTPWHGAMVPTEASDGPQLGAAFEHQLMQQLHQFLSRLNFTGDLSSDSCGDRDRKKPIGFVLSMFKPPNKNRGWFQMVRKTCWYDVDMNHQYLNLFNKSRDLTINRVII